MAPHPDGGRQECGGLPISIGPQFWVYDLAEYESSDSKLVSGLGGRWISVRYTRKKGQATTRDQLSLLLAIAHEPEVLILDEPITGLPPSACQRS